MTIRWDQLLKPISEERPCGENLEDTELLASFDAFRLFGRPRPLDAPAEQDEREKSGGAKPPEPPDWVKIRDKALEALEKSKDLRLLATLGTAALRTDGVPAFSDTLSVASQWLESHWSQVYPLVDEDVVLRRNALNCFADPMAVIDGLRRTRLVNSRQHGAFSLRDMEIASHQLTPGESDQQVDEAQVNAAFSSTAMTELSGLHESITAAVASLKSIDAKMRDAAGTEATPGFDPLTAQLVKMSQALRAQIALHPDSAAATISGAEEGAGENVSGATGPVKSRQDAIRALDAVADFFKRTEPSSPIPLFLARAKRLVSKDFLEVLADIAPDAVPQARSAGGLKNE